MIEFEHTFDGGLAEDGLLEFYDAARALAGFQRSLALTTHLALNGEIITHAPEASGLQIFIPPFIEGSWKARDWSDFCSWLSRQRFTCGSYCHIVV